MGRSESPSAPLPELEIHVPISPTPLFFTRIHYLAASLQIYGRELKGSPIIVTVGADQDPEDLHKKLPWSRHYPVEWRWMERELFREYSYFATKLRRFTYDYRARNVMMLDADVLVVRPFTDLIAEVARKGAFVGITAHVSPVRDAFTWETLFAAAGLGAVPYVCEHGGFGLMFHDPRHRYSPPYFNLGVLVAPQNHMRQIGRTIFAELAVVRRFEDFFRAQMSLTLAIQRHQIPWDLMDLKYNFPNDQRFVERYPEDFADMRLVHYLRKDQFDKDVDFETPGHISLLIQRSDLNQINSAFLQRLRPVHDYVISRTTKSFRRSLWHLALQSLGLHR